MRLALMTEPQQGLTYDEILAARAHRRGGRPRGLLPLRPLRQLPGPRRRTHHRCLGHAGRTGARHEPDRHRLAGLADDLPPARPLRQGGGHRRRDERRPGGGRHGGWLERRWSTRSWASRSRALDERYDHARGGAGDHARALDRARWLALRRRALAGARRAVPAAGPSAAAAATRRSSWAAMAGRAWHDWPRSMRTSSTSTPPRRPSAPRGVRADRRCLPGDRSRPDEIVRSRR